MTPATAAGVPLPASVMSGEPPLSPGGKSRRTGVSSRKAPSATDIRSNGVRLQSDVD